MPIRVPKDRKGNPTGPGADGEALRLLALVKAGTVDPREAVDRAHDKNTFIERAHISGGSR